MRRDQKNDDGHDDDKVYKNLLSPETTFETSKVKLRNQGILILKYTREK